MKNAVHSGKVRRGTADHRSAYISLDQQCQTHLHCATPQFEAKLKVSTGCSVGKCRTARTDENNVANFAKTLTKTAK